MHPCLMTKSYKQNSQLDQIANTFGNGGGSDKEAINGALGGKKKLNTNSLHLNLFVKNEYI